MPASHTPEPGSERTLRSGVRNPRRRQRQSDGDSLRTSAPRRKRSKLSEDAFAPRNTTEDTESVASSTAMNGHLPASTTGRNTRPRKESTPLVLDATLPVRGAKKAGTVKHRTFKGDGATVLTLNPFYSAKLLTSTPRELRQAGVEYRGSLGAGHHALAVTRTQAVVWDYSAHTTVSNARSFAVPFPAKEGEALPFGALIAGSGSTDVGLLLVSATTGRVMFYESIERAASLGLFQKHQTGVEGMISGFSSSETVTELTSAEHAGWIVTLSSGRIIHLTLRDAQGKARIFTQPLRPGDASSGGIFGSIKGLWSGAWKRGVTALRARALDQRGQMQAIALTERCEMQIWDLDWTGRYEFRSAIDFREIVMDDMKSLYSVEQQGRAESLAALDFVILDKSQTARNYEVATLGAEQPLSVWLLLKIGYLDSQDYAVVEMSLAGNTASIDRTLKLESYHGLSTGQKPRLLLPKPGHTAMVVFEDSIALIATAEVGVADDPNAQLHDASYLEPQPFEDAVYLRSDKDVSFLGACTEDIKGGHASSIAFVKGVGIVRMSAFNPSGDVERSRVPAKTKIEQAVLYGAMQDNILDFSRTGDSIYTVEEVEEATLAVSDEILRSDLSSILGNPTSMEKHLENRAKALRALVSHVRRNYPGLSHAAMWKLLWDAERAAAAKELWRAFEQHKEAVSKVKRTATVLDELCSQLEQHHGLESLDENGEDDVVRRFFVKGLKWMDYVLSHIRGLLETLRQSEREAPQKIVRYVAEADDIWARAMEAIFSFRADNAAMYGIPADRVPDGVLNVMGEYADLPEFWTSTHKMLNASSHIAKLSRELAQHYYEEAADPNTPAAGLEGAIKQITQINPRLIQVCCLLYKERINWLSSRPAQKEQSQARALLRNFEAERYVHFRSLAEVGLADQGMLLAEQYRDMHTLTELVVMENQYYLEGLEDDELNADQRETCTTVLMDIQNRISRYFDKFGDEWANAFFDEAFSSSRAGIMLEEAQKHWGEALTSYLRASSSRAKICWIYDISAKEDYGHAATVLSEVAAEQETRLWAKQVELSMSKLCLLASHEGKAPRPSRVEMQAECETQRRELRITDVQQRLLKHVRQGTQGALDRQAEVELAMKRFGSRTLGYTHLHSLLEISLGRIIDHFALSVEELIDVLTLMDSSITPSETGRSERSLEGGEFALALEALEAAAPKLDPTKFETLLRLIWKRCYMSDDWAKLTTAQSKRGKTDADVQNDVRRTTAWRTLYHLFSTQVLDDSTIRTLPPSACVGAACRPEDLSHRFEGELLDGLLQDNRMQDELVLGYVEDRRLDEWVADAERDAKEVVEADLEELVVVQGEERRLEGEEERAREVADRDVGGVRTVNGGLVNGVHDEQEDVEMEME